TNLEFFTLRRAPWLAVEGDQWQEVARVEEAIAQTGKTPQRVFVALGRQELGPVLQAPQHHYVIRSVDPIEPPLSLPHISYILARGPFDEAGELTLLRHHKINLIIAKNSGGPATYGKLAAARTLKIPVILIKRPPVHNGASIATLDQAVLKLDHLLSSSKKRGV
ncbi:MAG: precorrin-6A/cobalt-precorrin-6A reductase, partial [Hyphomicrobiaceae bacterium]|nr:precorrin-6A/cobalt-precorrin-6A reductase [Hyphomicrobiaceae bacterium]